MTAAVVVALALSACGGGGSSSGGGGGSATGPTSANASAVKEAVLHEEVSSSEMFFAGEGAPFCEQFTAKGRAKVLGEIAQELGVEASCAQVMGGLAKGIGAPVKALKREVAELTPADVTVNGTEATITFPASAPVTLEESGGRWYITRGP